MTRLPNADADGHRRLQIADVPIVDPQNVVPVDDDRELQQRGQKPQIGVAHKGPGQHAVGANQANLLAKDRPADWD